MKRLLIFSILFAPLALVIFNAPDVVMRRDFKLLDLTTLGLAYTFLIVPALIVAAVDWKFESLEGTTIAGVLLAFLAAFSIGFPFLDLVATLMVGLMGGAPAAACSWLSGRSLRRANA